MKVQSDLAQVQKAIRNSNRVAKDGHHFEYCFAEHNYIEVEDGYMLDIYCNEEKVEIFSPTPDSNDGGIYPGHIYDQNTDQGNEFEDNDSGYDDFGFDSEDTGQFQLVLLNKSLLFREKVFIYRSI